METALEALNADISWSDELLQSYRRYSEHRIDRCLLIFSMMEMIMMPGLFLAGCYGMNFADADFIFIGLDSWYSYIAWWGIVLVLLVLMVSFFYYKGYLPIPSTKAGRNAKASSSVSLYA